MNVDLHIERLVLNGLPLTHRQGIVLQNALERELSRLLEQRGIEPTTMGAVPQLPLAAIQLSASGQPAQWGRQIAHTLYAGIANPRPANRGQPKHLRGGSKPPPASRQPAAQ
ncbi:MAG TPA: hypothetical protein VGM64_19965 [Lacunisphaera sp.]|jgi:hypothetical protein